MLNIQHLHNNLYKGFHLMDNKTPYQRLELFWQSLGMKKARAFVDSVPGLTSAGISAMKIRGGKPNAETMRAIQRKYPLLNPNYINWGEGDMKLAEEGESSGKSATELRSGEETVSESEALLELAKAEATIEAQKLEIAWLRSIVGKESPSSDAADDDEATDPTAPAGPLPQPMLSVQHRRRAGFRQQGVSLD